MLHKITFSVILLCDHFLTERVLVPWYPETDSSIKSTSLGACIGVKVSFKKHSCSSVSISGTAKIRRWYACRAISAAEHKGQNIKKYGIAENAGRSFPLFFRDQTRARHDRNTYFFHPSCNSKKANQTRKNESKHSNLYIYASHHYRK